MLDREGLETSIGESALEFSICFRGEFSRDGGDLTLLRVRRRERESSVEYDRFVDESLEDRLDVLLNDLPRFLLP